MNEDHITRSLREGYTIRVVASTAALPRVPAGASFRSLLAFEIHLERARTERRTTGAVLQWSLHSDDRAVTYEGRIVFDECPVDVCATMVRYSATILGREGLFPPAVVARAKVIRLAAAALSAAKRQARAAHARQSERLFEFALAMLQTSLSTPRSTRGELRTVRGEA